MIATMRASFLAVVVALSNLAAPSFGQTMEFACPDPGTTFTYDSGTNVVSRGKDKDGIDCNMEIVGGKPYKLRALLFDNPAPGGADMTAFINALKPERLWPLDVGKKIEARYSAGGNSWNYTLQVVRYEKRTGPRDALIDTFVIEMLEQGSGDHRAVSRWWIAPVDRFAIRYDFSDGTGKANRAIVTNVSR